MKALIGVFGCGLLAVACGASKPEAKTAANVPPPPTAATADAGQAPAADTTAVTDAGVPEAPPAPDATPPSGRPPIVQVVWDGLTREVADGETFSLDGDQRRQLFFYSSAAAPDCSNVNAVGLIARTMAGLCQVAFLPYEQQFKQGEERAVSITVNKDGLSVVRSFRVARR